MLLNLVRLGIDSSTPQFEKRCIGLVNLLSITFFLFVFLYHAIGIVFYEYPLLPVFFCLGTYQVGLLAVPFLNYLGRTSAARHLFLGHTLLMLTLASLLIGSGTLVHLYLLSGFFSAYYAYPRKQRAYSYLWCLLFFAAFCFVEFWQANPLAVQLHDSGYHAAVRLFTLVGGISSINFIKSLVSHVLLQSTEASVEQEQEKVERLLNNTLPAKIVTELKEFGVSEPRVYNGVTVFFSDIVEFTAAASQLEPQVLIGELNAIFTGFDLIFERHHCERIKTIGDAYLAVCGMDSQDQQHCANILRAAQEAIGFLERRNGNSPLQWRLRVGIHTGEVVGGIVGIRKYIYDVFGDTINTAQRMESSSEAMRINVSEAVYLLEKDHFVFTRRQLLQVKGKGEIRMYWLDGEKPRAAAGGVRG